MTSLFFLNFLAWDFEVFPRVILSGVDLSDSILKLKKGFEQYLGKKQIKAQTKDCSIKDNTGV